MSEKGRTFIDKCIKDDKGSVTIFQSPNLLIIIWVATTLLTKITIGSVNTLLGLLAFGTLFTWAWLELFQGVNYLRRVLGLVVLGLVIYGRL